MSNCSTSPATPHSSFFRRPTYRAPSPPTWACYEQIPYDDYSDSGSEDDSCSEDDEEYHHPADSSDAETAHAKDVKAAGDNGEDIHNMDIDEVGDGNVPTADGAAPGLKKDVKGKQRAIEPDTEPELPKKPRERRKRRQPVYNLRPILTIHKSQGFVWNQDLFVPPYIKDRYVASTSPPAVKGFTAGSWSSSTASSLNDYEVEVVEIRVKEGELDDIIS